MRLRKAGRHRGATLEQAASEWRQRLLRAESRQAAVRRRSRLCQRRIHQLRNTLTVLQADVSELEQQAAAALKASDREHARALSGRISEQDATMRLAIGELRRLESRRRRLALLERCWGWRAAQHRRAGTLRQRSLLVLRERRALPLTDRAIRAR